jgi:UDP-3-O-[3-hydroxymyristoyl] glucosamine N-acyltransferase LpxD
VSIKASLIANFLNAKLRGRDVEVVGVSSLSSPVDRTLCFAKKVSEPWNGNETCVYLVPIEHAGMMSSPHIAVLDPRTAFAEAATEFFAERIQPAIAPTARIGQGVTLSRCITIEEYAIIEDGVLLGEGTTVGNHAVIRRNTQIGSRCWIKSHAVIGESGLGIVRDKEGQWLRMPHFGAVKIGDDCEIGSFTTVCRGTIDDTVVGRGCKVDDHVHIAHNVQLGENVVVVANAEISGGVKIGPNSWIGPNATIRDGCDVGEGCFVGMGAVVTKSLAAFGVYAGNPAKILKKSNS